MRNSAFYVYKKGLEVDEQMRARATVPARVYAELDQGSPGAIGQVFQLITYPWPSQGNFSMMHCQTSGKPLG